MAAAPYCGEDNIDPKFT